MAKATRGSDAQFTYDFGIAIAQSTVNQVARLAGVTLSLASAFYALKSTATEYVNTLRENTFRFGGILSTMKAMEQAQDRLIKGQSLFSVDDQLRGMNQLMASGINIKKNLDWISKAAHASGQSLSQFSGAISNAIAGNMSQLVDMGLLTQRATRMFDKYAANTVMRQQAILNFLKSHKGLMAAIRNDFYTIQDQMLRIKETWKAFLQSILGKPNDPSGFYGQIAQSMKLVADALARNLENIKRVGWMIGQVLGWVMKQIGHFVVWLGKTIKHAISYTWVAVQKFRNWLVGDSGKQVTTVQGFLDHYVEYTRSLIVWLEFWKLKLIEIFETIGNAFKKVYNWIVDFAVAHPIITKIILAIGAMALAWKLVGKQIMHCYRLQMAYIAFQGPALNKVAVWFQSLAAWMPQPFRRAWVASGKYLGRMGAGCIGWCNRIGVAFKNLGLLMIAPFKSLAKLVPGLLKTAFSGIGLLGSGPLAMFTKGAKGIHFKRLFLGYKSIAISGMRDLWAAVMAFVKPIGKIFSSLFGPLFNFLTGGLKNIGNLILNLPRLIGIAFNAIKGLWTALNATNPVGWIILAVTAVITLYTKCRTFRIFVNTMFKAWWEYIKLLWNLLYGAFLYCWVAIKKTWNWFKNYIYMPIANFFKRAWTWIKDMWKAFKDTSVGRFIDKWIVQPLKKLFDWMVKAWHWIIKACANIVEWISGANSELAKNLNKMAAENGLPQLAVSGGKYKKDDATNYVNPANWGVPDSPKNPGSVGVPDIPANPISDVTASVGGGGGGGGGTTVNNNMDFGNGAIQIIVQKGEQIDENKLARLVRDTIKDVNREQNMRGGTI